jgi:hypothetical protein
MSNRFASGKHSIAECDRCGQQYKLKKLKFEVVKTKLSKLIDNVSRTKIPVLSDEEGLSKAYDQPNKIYIKS